jgi:hypothetical protein
MIDPDNDTTPLTYERLDIQGRDPPSAALPKIIFKVLHEGKIHTVTFARFDDGRVAEIYLTGGHICATMGRLTSMLLQNGIGLRMVRRGVIGGPMAMALDRLIEMDGGRTTAEPTEKGNGQ